ncbi:DUF4040 domain-containing protein [Suttonella sp. R2A3]|uniref:hydrogen gas-evolving membrane-bound hydrogenase subunit E n=1 Tax=Suttonella sp. R2A3 TaxID=2908648 RepID=UPI001F27FFDA|nr:hydrogen gas-evolving membrane-bound hydrogenase subunit E [Suttonella sp. R2A3]UJF24024.1 DUF4040 domain-containing protein [Suttonella sp. R2A3]
MAGVDPRLHGTPLTNIEKALWCALPVLGLLAVLATWANFSAPYVWQWSWFSGIGVDLAFRVDGFALLMLFLITGVGSAVFLYAAGYLSDHPQLRRLYILLCAFALTMVGCVLADDLILLFVFWELTSVLSFLLVGFNFFDSGARDSAKQAMLVTGSGGLCLLVGAIWLGQLTGTTRLSEITAVLPQYLNNGALLWAMALIMIGAFTKSAQFPFQFWLPNAMAAPTPVSAYLHSATMVKLGVYLLARFDVSLSDWSFWQISLQTIGSMTAGWGILLALKERDLKRILAWSTVATLGTLVVLIGLPGDRAALGVAAFLLAHAMYKAPLFFVAGNVDHSTGTRVIDCLGRLRRVMPWTATAATLAGISMAGMPLSFGFIAKEVLIAAKSGQQTLTLTIGANTVFSIIAVAVAGVATIRIFWRRPGVIITPPNVHEVSKAMIIPPLTIAALGLLFGIFPQIPSGVLQSAAQAILGQENLAVDLHLDVALVRSSATTIAYTLLLGAAVFFGWDILHRGFDRFLAKLPKLGGGDIYDRVVGNIPATTAEITRRVQHGSLSIYASWLIMFTITTLGAALLWAGLVVRDIAWPDWAALGPIPGIGLSVAVILLIAGAYLTTRARRSIVLILTSGLVGYGSALVFVFSGAVDVALTQFVVETILVIVLVSILLMLRRSDAQFYRHHKGDVRETGIIILALVVATLLTVAIALMLAIPFNPDLTKFFAAESYVSAHGLNVVNVILVDFRAMDTFGEASVLLLSLLAAWPLLRSLRRRGKRLAQMKQQGKHL